MNRFITKILDEYYTHKLIDKIKDFIICTYNLDLKTEWKGNNVILYVKKRKHKDEYYEQIYTFNYCDSLMWLINLNSTKEIVDNNIKGYLKF